MDTPTLKELPCFAVYSATKRVMALYRPLLNELDITYPQFVVLMALWESDTRSMSELSTHTTLGNSTLSPLVRLLEHKGLVAQTMPASDERLKLVSLTLRGKRLARKARRITDTAFTASGLSARDAKTLIRICGSLPAA
ncbi:MAG: MarR family transcriptional regulator [Pseudomonadota bacterium]